MALLDSVNISDSDQLVMLGDYIDRGPDSAKVIEFLVGDSKPKGTICLKGNHEIMMEQARDQNEKRIQWMFSGGNAACTSYESQFGGKGIENVPDSHWQFLEQCLPYHETNSHVFVHAALYGEVALSEQPDYMLYWEKFDSITPLESGKTVVCGHTSQKSGIPKNAGHAICIDTYAHGNNGWLTCLDVNSGRYYQANQSGDLRSEWLEEESYQR